MRISLFYHSAISDWNHGNAHFLRGVAAELQRRGHEVVIYEPRDAWSRMNLVRERGADAERLFRVKYPQLHIEQYDRRRDGFEAWLHQTLEASDLAIVHEWSDPELVRLAGECRASLPSLRLLFHDTHHRAVTRPAEMERYDLRRYDGALCFGAVLTDLYLRRGWVQQAWTWHEAADTHIFRPLDPTLDLIAPLAPGVHAVLNGSHRTVASAQKHDLLWIGNWGDDERTTELREFLIEPVRRHGLSATVHGVRYPREAIHELETIGARFCGWLPNPKAPDAFAAHRATIHVPRRPYVEALPGIPTIRVFEALACGIPLVSAPWDDAEGLFAPGQDFRVARTGVEMGRHLRDLVNDPAAAHEQALRGLRTVRARHTCAHRVDELLAICAEIGAGDALASRRAPAPSRVVFLPSSSRPAPGTKTMCSLATGSRLRLAFFGSSLVSSYWNGAATYYRGVLRALASRGWRITFYEPDAFDRQANRDIDDPSWARVVVYDASSAREVERLALRAADDADLVVKASGVGAHDALLERVVATLPNQRIARVFWDVDAAATLDTIEPDRTNPMRAHIPRYDGVLTYGGGDAIASRYRALGAVACTPIYNGLDPETHHPAPPDHRFACDLAFLGNRLPDREARVEEFFLKPADMLPESVFLLGGSGWDARERLSPNIRVLGHVSTRDHNAFNSSPKLVLNISRDSMARAGFSPATRVFEAAGAGACLVTDAWNGLELFLEPGREALVAENGKDVARLVETISSDDARAIGAAARERMLAEHTYDRRAQQADAALRDCVARAHERAHRASSRLGAAPGSNIAAAPFSSATKAQAT